MANTRPRTSAFTKYSQQTKCAHVWDSAVDANFFNYGVVGSVMCDDCSVTVFD